MSGGHPLTVRVAVQATRAFLMVAIIFTTGMVTAVMTAIVSGSTTAFGFGALAGALLCLSPEVWQLVILRVAGDRQGQIRTQDLRLALRSPAECIPHWHPDSATADRSR